MQVYPLLIAFASPLIFSHFLFSLFFLRDCRPFPMRDGNFLFSFIGAVQLSAYLRLFEIFRGASLAHHLQRVLEYGLLYTL